MLEFRSTWERWVLQSAGQGGGKVTGWPLLTHMGLSWQMVSLLLDPRWADTGRAARGLGEQGTLPGDQQATSGGMEAVGQVLQAGDLCQDSQRAAGWGLQADIQRQEHLYHHRKPRTPAWSGELGGERPGCAVDSRSRLAGTGMSPHPVG